MTAISMRLSLEELQKSFDMTLEALVVPEGDVKKLEPPIEKGIKSSFYVSDKPMISLSIADCNAVILIGEKYFGLSHEYIGKDTNPKNYYLLRMIDDISEKEKLRNLKNLSAILVAGDDEHFDLNKWILKKSKIPIIESYQDHWNVGEKVDKSDKIKCQKDILVVPEKKTVMMFKLRPYKRQAETYLLYHLGFGRSEISDKIFDCDNVFSGV